MGVVDALNIVAGDFSLQNLNSKSQGLNHLASLGVQTCKLLLGLPKILDIGTYQTQLFIFTHVLFSLDILNPLVLVSHPQWPGNPAALRPV